MSKYRFNRRGEVVRDARDPHAKRTSSPARDRFKAARLERRALARTAAARAAAAMHDAAVRAGGVS